MIYVLSGSSSLHTVIVVRYPSGSICTCGGKPAKDTSGFALFNVRPGTYTVECHTSDNSQSKSTSVTVAESDKGKSKSVTLGYEIIIPVTSGDNWTKIKTSANGEISFSSSGITITAVGAEYSEAKYNTAIDFSSYSTAEIVTDYVGGNGGFYVRILDSTGTEKAIVHVTSTGTKRFDVSNVGTGYIDIKTETASTYEIRGGTVSSLTVS